MIAAGAPAQRASWTWPLRCSNCGRGYPARGLPYRCPTCGGVYDLDEPLRYLPPETPVLRRGLGRYRASLPLPPDAPFYSLGEGGTPLVPIRLDGRRVYFKCEHLNPAGSFKDRGTAVLVSGLRAVGVEQAVEDSSGNAGASFAAYAARAGIRATVFVPDSASAIKRRQIESYGANLVRILGARSKVAEMVREAAAHGEVYASHAWRPSPGSSSRPWARLRVVSSVRWGRARWPWGRIAVSWRCARRG